MLTRKLDGFMDDTFPVQCFYIYLTFGVIFSFLPAISGKSDWFAFYNIYSSIKYLDVEDTHTGSCLPHTTKYPTRAFEADQQHWVTVHMCVTPASWKCSASLSHGNTPIPPGDCRSASWTDRKTSSIYHYITAALMSFSYPPTPIFYSVSAMDVL